MEMDGSGMSHSPSSAIHPATTPPPSLEPEKEFILNLEMLPLLWDKTHRFYVNKYKRHESLQKLLVILKKVKPASTVEDVKKKINTLRSNYRRDLKKIEQSRRSGVGADDVYTPKSWTFEFLHFLNKFEKPQIGSDNEEDAETQTEVTKSQESTSSKACTSTSSVKAVLPPPPTSTRVKKSLINKQNELLDKAVAYLSECEPKGNTSNSIAFDWAQTLDRLDPTQKLFAKKAINDVLFEAELGNLNRHSVQINVAVPCPNEQGESQVFHVPPSSKKS